MIVVKFKIFMPRKNKMRKTETPTSKKRKAIKSIIPTVAWTLRTKPF